MGSLECEVSNPYAPDPTFIRSKRESGRLARSALVEG
jgi:hypothetical protein